MADIARLVLQVDAATELARRNISALAAAVEGDTQKMDRSLKRVDDAHARLAKSSGSSRIAQMEFSHVITASTDALNAGIPIQRVFAMEMGRIAQAAQYATDGTGAFGKFITGPWGMALQVGISLLTMLAMRHGEAGKAASDQKIEDMDLTKALKALDEATKGAITSERQHQIELINSAAAVNAKALATRNATQAALRDAIATAEARERAFKEQGPNLRGEARADLRDAALTARDTVASLQARLKENEAAIVEAERRRAAALIPLMEQRSKEISDPAEGARGAAARQVDALRAAFNKTGDLSDDAVHRFILAEAGINAARDAEIKKIEEQRQAQGRLADTRASGRHVTVAEAESIVRSIGGQVNSGFRSHARQQELYDAWVAEGRPADNPVAKPGTSGHERGTSLDVQMRSGITLGRIVEAFRAEGVAASGFPERGHYHINFAGPQGGRGPSATTIQHREASAERQSITDDKTFEAQLVAANRDLLRARRGVADTAAEQFAIAREEVRNELHGQLAALADQAASAKVGATAKQRQLIDVRTQQLIAVRTAVADQKIEDLAIQQAVQNRLEYNSKLQDQLRGEEEIERIRGQLADTASARRDSELRQLEIATTMEREALETARDTAKDDAKRQQAEDALARLDQKDALQRQVILRQNETPGQTYLRSLNSQSINNELDQVKVRGLQSLEDGLVDIVSGTESVSHAFKRMAQSIIADLARIAIEREIIQPLANALFGGADGGGGGGLGSLLSIFGHGGGSISSTSAGSFNGIGLQTFGFAAGGDPPVGRVSLVGERGPELIVPRSPMTVIPNHMINRGGGSGGHVTEIHIHAQDSVLASEVRQWVAQGVEVATQRGATLGARTVIRQLTRPTLI